MSGKSHGRALIEALGELAERYGLLAVYVFGSRAEEIAAGVGGVSVASRHPGSDVDVGVEPQRGRRLTARDRVRVADELERLLNVKHVDLVVLPEANAFLAADVVRGELLLATDLDAEAEAQLYYLCRAADLAPFLREQWSEMVGTEP